MFVIKTRVGPSTIHGTGVFACEPAEPGQVIWRFLPPLDQVISDADFEALPVAAREHLETYSYRSTDLGGQRVLSGDHAKFLNHADDPNTEEQSFVSVARRIIRPGDEITCDYGAFCADWDPAEVMPWAVRSEERGAIFRDEVAMPHYNLYTRIRGAANGVGVFAIRDIPAGTVLFAGDTGPTVRVPISDVMQIEDLEIRRMYLDFCPVVSGALVCPADFNQLTMGWYLNHSDEPNIAADVGVQFYARVDIPAGSELTSDYTTYSEHAVDYIRNNWSLPVASGNDAGRRLNDETPPCP